MVIYFLKKLGLLRGTTTSGLNRKILINNQTGHYVGFPDLLSSALQEENNYTIIASITAKTMIKGAIDSAKVPGVGPFDAELETKFTFVSQTYRSPSPQRHCHLQLEG